MGEAEDGAVEAHDLSGGQEADRGGAESTVGEGEESGVAVGSVSELDWLTTAAPATDSRADARRQKPLHTSHIARLGSSSSYRG